MSRRATNSLSGSIRSARSTMTLQLAQVHQRGLKEIKNS
ncbi:MAG: hypothetical protein OJF60_001029 [Burkholderiaceae bacterium]|nr:MAG: hypothetical protein OJF60_001029 [Burkholderiaceae bacterium]